MLLKWLVVVGSAPVWLSAGLAWAAPCMVLGDKTAVVHSEEGDKSPAFLTQACEKLKLKSGKAMVSWVSRDGRPQMAPVTPEGVSRYPAAGSEERSAKVVWSELTTRREVPRAAVMRNMSVGDERPAPVYVPIPGLEVRPGGGVDWQLRVVSKAGGEMTRVLAAEPGRFVLDRAVLRPGQAYVLEWTGGTTLVQWHWRVLPEAQMLAMDAQHASLVQADLDAEQLNVLRAMWFEQLRLPLNMNLTLRGMP